MGLHFGDKCRWGRGTGRAVIRHHIKLLMSLKKEKEKYPIYSEARAKKMTVGLTTTDIYGPLIMVPGTFLSPLHVNTFNPCNNPMRSVLLLFPFTEEETGTEKLRRLLQVTQLLSGRIRNQRKALKRHSPSSLDIKHLFHTGVLNCQPCSEFRDGWFQGVQYNFPGLLPIRND